VCHPILVRPRDWVLTDEFVEVESGRRRELKAALDACKRLKARLVVATMSRLTRDPKVLGELQDAGVDMVFCDLPEIPAGPMGRLFLRILAHVNEFEAAQTGERTKLALKDCVFYISRMYEFLHRQGHEGTSEIYHGGRGRTAGRRSSS
jgi:DNA invertase Pin-like site-specific DNA recombinase